MIEADATLFEQALSNLVDNAIRYNRPGGHVAVVLDAREPRFEVTVTDDGPGVSEDDLAALGQRSFRSDAARSRRPDGQGRGLDIARRATERLGFALRFQRPATGGLHAAIAGPLARSTRP